MSALWEALGEEEEGVIGIGTESDFVLGLLVIWSADALGWGSGWETLRLEDELAVCTFPWQHELPFSSFGHSVSVSLILLGNPVLLSLRVVAASSRPDGSRRVPLDVLRPRLCPVPSLSVSPMLRRLLGLEDSREQLVVAPLGL